MNLPNTLSLFRIILAAAFTAFMTLDLTWAAVAALACFIIASITDWLDGYLARKLNLVTDMGKLLDPLADKILVAAAFVCFTEKGICPAWVTVVILFREFSVTGLRLLLVEKGVVLPADQWGKYKTVFQMVYCICILIGTVWEPPFTGYSLLTSILLWCAVLLTVLSGLNYTIKGLKVLRD